MMLLLMLLLLMMMMVMMMMMMMRMRMRMIMMTVMMMMMMMLLLMMMMIWYLIQLIMHCEHSDLFMLIPCIYVHTYIYIYTPYGSNHFLRRYLSPQTLPNRRYLDP